MSVAPISNPLSTPNALLAGWLGPGALSSAHRNRPAASVTPAEKVTRSATQTTPPDPARRPDQARPAGAPTKTSRSSSATQVAPGVWGGAAYQTNADGDSAQLSSQLNQLSPEEAKQIEDLKKRDAEVRTHEQAHLAAAGGLARGGPTYDYQTGPDGNRYAIGGNVQIDTSPGRTPEETIRKAQQIKRAALAPAEPSSTDRAVAAKATRMEAQAQRELTEQRTRTNESDSESINPASGAPMSDSPTAQLASPRLDLFA